MKQDTEVLIIGAGPTGLMLAAQLAARGVPAVIVEKRRERSKESRALVVQARSLELLDDLGLADHFVAAGRKAVGAEIIARGAIRAQIEIGNIAADDTRYPYALFLAQSETERFLEEYLATQGVTVRREVTLESFSQDENGIRATLSSARGKEECSARYLVGCDGAHSVVRKGLGLAFEGGRYQQEFLLGDVTVDGPVSTDKLLGFLEQAGLLVVFPLDDKTWRLVATGHETSDSESVDLSLKELETVANEISGKPFRLSNPKWLTRFRLHHRVVNRYRVDRGFVAGDAAHVHSPAGGQGMNTGLQDATNLAWKLAQAVKGSAPALLESYEAERRPIGLRLLRSTDRFFQFATSRNPVVRFLRLYVAPTVIQRVAGSRERRRRAFRFISELGIRYRRSALVSGERRTPGAGDRAPDAPVKRSDGTPTRLYEAFRGPGHDILLFGDFSGIFRTEAQEKIVELTKRLGPRLAEPVRLHVIGRAAGNGVTLVDTGGIAFTRFGVTGEAIFGLRPDAYIGYRGTGDGAIGLENYFKGLVGD